MPDIFVSPEKKEKKSVEGHHTLPDRKIPHLPGYGSGGTLSSFRYFPKKINFETQDDDEKIILMLRQHPITNLGWVLLSIILFITPGMFEKTGLLNLLPSGFQLVIKLTWYLVTFAYAMEGFFKWYFNVFFVTTRRIIDIDFFNLINKRVSDAEIDKIQDVTYSTSGPIGTIFNFGSVLVQTASEQQELDFHRVPNPEKVADVLDDLRKNV